MNSYLQRYIVSGPLAEKLGIAGEGHATYQSETNGQVSVEVQLNLIVRGIQNLSPKLYVTDLRRIEGEDDLYIAAVSRRGKGRSFEQVGTLDVQLVMDR